MQYIASHDLNAPARRPGNRALLLTAAVGGPWEVRPEGTGVPLVHPPVVLTVAAGVIALVAVVLSSLRRRGAWLAWLMVGG